MPVWRPTRRRQPTLNAEPVRPRGRRQAMSKGELYEWHKANGTLDVFFAMFPEP